MGDDPRTSIPPDPKAMAYLLREFRNDQKAVAASLSNISGSLRSINTEISNIKDYNKIQDERIQRVEDKHNGCTAARDVEGLNARVKRLEKYDRDGLKDRADASSAMDLTLERERARAEALANYREEKKDKNPWKNFLSPQIIIALVLAILLGSSLGGFLLAKAYGAIDEPHLKSIQGEKKR